MNSAHETKQKTKDKKHEQLHRPWVGMTSDDLEAAVYACFHIFPLSGGDLVAPQSIVNRVKPNSQTKKAKQSAPKEKRKKEKTGTERPRIEGPLLYPVSSPLTTES